MMLFEYNKKTLSQVCRELEVSGILLEHKKDSRDSVKCL